MKSYTHIAGAVLLFLFIAYFLNLNNLWVGILFSGWISVMLDPLDRLIGEHRGIGHSVFLFLPGIILIFFNFTIGVALIVGIFSHLFLDSFTVHGVPILYPINKTNFVALPKKKRIKTGTNHEKALFLVLILLLIPALYFTLEPTNNTTSVFGINVPTTLNNHSENTITNSTTSDPLKNIFNINLQLNQKTNKNITVKKVNENETNILIKDIQPGG